MFERYAPWPHGGNAASEACRKLACDRRTAKALYARFSAGPNLADTERAQARLNRVIGCPQPSLRAFNDYVERTRPAIPRRYIGWSPGDYENAR